MIKAQLVRSFTSAALRPDPDLAVAALMIARIEYPALDAGPYLGQADVIGPGAPRRARAPSSRNSPSSAPGGGAASWRRRQRPPRRRRMSIPIATRRSWR